MIKTLKAFFILSLALPFSACAYKSAGEPPSYFGNAVRQNIAAQVVNPDAPEDKGPPEYYGSRLTVGQQRYVLDEVEKPKKLKTSDIESGSESGGGGG